MMIKSKWRGCHGDSPITERTVSSLNKTYKANQMKPENGFKWTRLKYSGGEGEGEGEGGGRGGGGGGGSVEDALATAWHQEDINL